MPDLPSLRRRPREPTAYVIGRRASVTRNTRYRWPRRSSELPALSDEKALREELRPASGPQVSRQSITHGRDGRWVSLKGSGGRDRRGDRPLRLGWWWVDRAGAFSGGCGGDLVLVKLEDG